MQDTVIGLLINKVVVDATFMLDYRFHPLPFKAISVFTGLNVFR